MTRYSGADWLNGNGVDLSPFGTRVADLLGELFAGIYHIRREVRHKRVDWTDEGYIEIVVSDASGSLATYDSSLLTDLVILAHKWNVRISIRGAAPGYLRLEFMRVDSNGFFRDDHPSLDELAVNVAARRPLRESINYD